VLHEPNSNRYRDPALRESVDDARFLTADRNTARYRLIVRYFCDQMEERQRDWLAAEEIVELVRTVHDPAYTPEQADSDLAQLVAWENLLPDHDRSRARTVEEFKRRRQVYHVRERTVALDRLTRMLDRDEAGGGALDASLLERLSAALDGLRHTLEETVPDRPSEEFLRQRVWSPWDDAFRLFEQLRTGAVDFHHALGAARPQDLNRTNDFLAYKDVLLRNLESFILQLSALAPRIHHLFRRLEEHGSDRVLIGLVTRYRMEHLADAAGTSSPDMVREKLERQVRGVADWFRPGEGADRLKDTTRDAIRLVVRHNQRVVDRHRVGVSRARDLERLARAFAACPEAADAHRLAARSLGCVLSRHIQGSLDAHEMASGTPVWLQPSQEVALKRIRRGARRQLGAGAKVRDSREDQAKIIEAQIRREQREAIAWARIFTGGAVELAGLRVDDPAVRDRLLALVGECLTSPDRTAVGPDGTRLRLVLPAEREPPGDMAAPDGVVFGPRATLLPATDGDV
jgi:uncharacterized protein (TIGR02677 family)